MTLAGVDTFDTAADADFSSVLSLAPGDSASLPTFSGYAQAMDVAVDQSIPLDITVSVTADCGSSSVVAAVVDSVKLTGKDDDIAAVFLGLQLPVATRYFVNVTNNAKTSIALTTTGVTYSTSITAGGVVTLGGDVTGPSSSNTVVKWRGIAIDAATFNGPVDAAIPIYDSGATTWRALAMSGDATMTDAGVVTIDSASVTLDGDVAGAADANTVNKWKNVLLGASMATPSTGDVPQYNGTDWEAVLLSTAVTLGGDVTGLAGANTVVEMGQRCTRHVDGDSRHRRHSRLQRRRHVARGSESRERNEHPDLHDERDERLCTVRGTWLCRG